MEKKERKKKKEAETEETNIEQKTKNKNKDRARRVIWLFCLRLNPAYWFCKYKNCLIKKGDKNYEE